MTSEIRRLAALAGIAAVLLSVAVAGLAGAAPAQTTGDASLRVLHASPDAGPVDVYVDGSLAVGNVAFGTHATLSVPAGEHTVTLTAAGNESDVVAETTVTAEAGVDYTVAASGEVASDASTPFKFAVYETNVTAPGSGEAAVRLAHLSPDAGPVDVTVAGSGDVVFDNVTFRNATGYVTVPAGDYTLEVRRATATDDGEIVATSNVTFEGGSAVTAVAVGYADPSADQTTAFRIVELTDVYADSDAETPSAATESTPEPAGESATETPTA